MSKYTPDRWVVIKITHPNRPSHYRVFGSWYGGYLAGDSWRMNSGITKVTYDDVRPDGKESNENWTDSGYLFQGSSGSLYHCMYGAYGLSGYGTQVLLSLTKESLANDGTVIEILPEQTNFMELNYE